MAKQLLRERLYQTTLLAESTGRKLTTNSPPRGPNIGTGHQEDNTNKRDVTSLEQTPAIVDMSCGQGDAYVNISILTMME